MTMLTLPIPYHSDHIGALLTIYTVFECDTFMCQFIEWNEMIALYFYTTAQESLSN